MREFKKLCAVFFSGVLGSKKGYSVQIFDDFRSQDSTTGDQVRCPHDIFQKKKPAADKVSAHRIPPRKFRFKPLLVVQPPVFVICEHFCSRASVFRSVSFGNFLPVSGCVSDQKCVTLAFGLNFRYEPGEKRRLVSGRNPNIRTFDCLEDFSVPL